METAKLDLSCELFTINLERLDWAYIAHIKIHSWSATTAKAVKESVIALGSLSSLPVLAPEMNGNKKFLEWIGATVSDFTVTKNDGATTRLWRIV